MARSDARQTRGIKQRGARRAGCALAVLVAASALPQIAAAQAFATARPGDNIPGACRPELTGLNTSRSAQQHVGDRDSRQAVAVYAGVGRHSPVGTHLGMTPDRDHVLFAIHYERRLIGAPRLALFYAPELVPGLFLSNNPTYEIVGRVAGGPIVDVTGRRAVYGFGATPVGFEAHARVSRRVQVYGASGAGIIWFTRAVPDPWARAFNFMFDIGAGVLWQVRDAYALRAGYMFHHLSNANTAPSNPGVDGAIWVVGVQHAVAGRHTRESTVVSAK